MIPSVLKKTRWAVLFFTAPVFFFGCAGTQRPSGSPPPWLSRMPQEQGVIYARGSCGRTSDPKDAEKRAIEEARVELSKTIKVEVSSLLVDYEKEGGSAFGGSGFVRDYSVRVNREALALSLAGSQVVSTWRDVGGKAGPSHTTYALVRLSRDDMVNNLSRLAREMLVEAEEVGQRSEGGRGLTPLIEEMKEKGIVREGGGGTGGSSPPAVRRRSDVALQELERELEKLRQRQ